MPIADGRSPWGDARLPLLVDSREAARLLAVSPRTLWTITQRGDLPAVRFGRAVRYRLIDLESFCAASAAQVNGRA